MTGGLPEGHPPAPAPPGAPVPSGVAPALRASDAERDAAVERLKTGLVEGRLSDEEFDQRMRAALTARTRADLERLLADLPATLAAAGPPSPPSRPSACCCPSRATPSAAGAGWCPIAAPPWPTRAATSSTCGRRS
jgi:hypothetical protein